MAENRQAKAPWTGWHTASLLAIIAAIILIGLLTPQPLRRWAWLATMVLLGIFATIAGQGVTNLWRGILIDERNKMSLSRLQMILWTVVILSGFLTAALGNIRIGGANPLSITIDETLWLLMGISTTSLVGSPLIRSIKKARPAKEEEKAQTFQLMQKQGVDSTKVDATGQIVINKSPEDARWSDMFKGEETGNAAHLDLAKIQMFYFTLILVLAYAAALAATFAGGEVQIPALPKLDAGMVALLGISHGGYLVHKAIPHSESGSNP